MKNDSLQNSARVESAYSRYTLEFPERVFNVGKLIEEVNTLEGIRFRCKACIK